MAQSDDRFKEKLLKKLDNMTSYNEKLCFLNDQFIKATRSRELVILNMIEQLKLWGA